MYTRRIFIKESAMVVAALSIPGCSLHYTKIYPPIKKRNPQNALILWYSQTGHTERYGRLIAKIWEKNKIKVDALDYRECDKGSLSLYDFIIFGSPVFHYDIPVNVKNWIKTIPRIDGIPVASFVSYGGPEGNQYNASCILLKILMEKGAVPIGMDMYMNIGTMPTPDWWGPGHIENIHLPNEVTYKKVREFALQLIRDVNSGNTIQIKHKSGIREFGRKLKLGPVFDRMYNKRVINKVKCIGCGTCIEKCPTEAINLSLGTINRHHCIGCFGCLNNCPSQAVEMEFMGRKLYGFQEFLARNKIKIIEPQELQ